MANIVYTVRRNECLYYYISTRGSIRLAVDGATQTIMETRARFLVVHDRRNNRVSHSRNFFQGKFMFPISDHMKISVFIS